MLSPRNGRFPVSARYSATQNANWSARGSTLWPMCCSGAMYAGVPTTASSRVRPVSSSAGDSSGADWLSWSFRAPTIPKSATFARPSAAISTFDGLKSRCTRPASCAA